MTMNAAEVMTLHRQALHTPADAPGSAQGRGQGRPDGRTQGDGAGFVELVPAPKDRGGFVADDFADDFPDLIIDFGSASATPLAKTYPLRCIT